MSNIIKFKGHAGKPNLKVAAIGTSDFAVEDTDTFKKQLENYYQTGFKEGEEKAKRELEQDYSSKLFRKYEEVYNILKIYDENLAEYEKAFEILVIQTAHELAKKIVQREIETTNVINENIRTAINKIIGANEVKLKLNPMDLQELTETSKNIIHSSSFSKIKIEVDDQIERGGCLIETEIGNVDARISTQLNKLKQQLLESL